MNKRKRDATDMKLKDNAVFFLMPLAAWFTLAGLVSLMAYVTR